MVFVRLLRRIAGLVLVASLVPTQPHAQDLRGHGGPVRAILITKPGAALTASFDTSIIRWDLATGRAEAVLRFHDGAVNALLALPGGGFASAGEDRRIALWREGALSPSQVLDGHEGPIAALALAPGGTQLASASWDGTVRVWDLARGTAAINDGHRGPVNGVLYLDDGTLVSAGYDGQLRLAPPGGQTVILDLGLPLNALIQAGDEIVVGGADGHLRLLDRAGGLLATLPVAEAPIVALAASATGDLIAAAGFRGALVLVDRRGRSILRRLSGPAFPLWSLAFSADDKHVLTGGADRLVRRWLVASGDPASPIIKPDDDAGLHALAQHPGAEIFKACSACHTLNEADGNRAGPTLHRLFGRRIASARDYAFSPALQGMAIVWDRASVARLFEIGPNAYLPGTKMPEQIIGNAADREALVDFLEQATR